MERLKKIMVKRGLAEEKHGRKDIVTRARDHLAYRFPFIRNELNQAGEEQIIEAATHFFEGRETIKGKADEAWPKTEQVTSTVHSATHQGVMAAMSGIEIPERDGLVIPQVPEQGQGPMQPQMMNPMDMPAGTTNPHPFQGMIEAARKKYTGEMMKRSIMENLKERKENAVEMEHRSKEAVTNSIKKGMKEVGLENADALYHRVLINVNRTMLKRFKEIGADQLPIPEDLKKKEGELVFADPQKQQIYEELLRKYGNISALCIEHIVMNDLQEDSEVIAKMNEVMAPFMVQPNLKEIEGRVKDRMENFSVIKQPEVELVYLTEEGGESVPGTKPREEKAMNMADSAVLEAMEPVASEAMLDKKALEAESEAAKKVQAAIGYKEKGKDWMSV